MIKTIWRHPKIPFKYLKNIFWLVVAASLNRLMIITLSITVVTKGDTLLNKLAARRCRFVKVCVTCCYHGEYKG